MKLLALVESAAARLTSAGVAFGHGTDNAFDEAAWLALWAMSLPLDALEEHVADTLNEEQVARVDALITDRIHTRKPAAYLTGEAWLHGVPFFVDERVIVPRSLIAEPIVEGTLDVWLSPETRTVLDLCTGNGSLAVLAAMAYPDVTIRATDLSAQALEVAQSNVARHGLEDRITLAQGDSFAAAPGRYDLILCNPPYVNSRSMADLPAEFRAEPQLALAGGADGMDFIRRLLREARAHLGPHGVLVLEVGHERQHFHDAFPRLPAVGLPTSLGDDQVLLLQAADLP
jgi:ribosomal protein L3 glutamine methyltransferase